eukprot:1146887-Pelagomonas_calceolata.AAC.4
MDSNDKMRRQGGCKPFLTSHVWRIVALAHAERTSPKVGQARLKQAGSKLASARETRKWVQHMRRVRSQ